MRFLPFVLVFCLFIGKSYTQALPPANKNYAVLFSNTTLTPLENKGRPDSISLHSMRSGDFYFGYLQFYDIPGTDTKKSLQDAGMLWGSYVKHYTYAVAIPVSSFPLPLSIGIRSFFSVEHPIKLSEELRNNAFSPDGTDELVVWVSHHKEPMGRPTYHSLVSRQFEIMMEYAPFQLLEVRLPSSRLGELASIPEVLWISPKPPENELYNLPGVASHRSHILGSNSLGSRNLTGDGVIVGEWDGAGVGPHIDYNDRLTNVQPFVNNTGGQHASHVCGTFGGAGNRLPFAKGMAPKVTIFAWDFAGNVTMEMDTSLDQYQFVITQNSYGYTPAGDPCSVRGRYDINSYGLDVLTNKDHGLLHVYANGNSRSSNCISGGFRTVSSGYQCAKNVLTVGAVTGNDLNSTFHSYGPALDGRIKPDVCGVGVDVISTMPNHQYSTMSGTSMACPGVSGTAAQLYEFYRQKNSGLNPPFHTIKAALCNTARDLGNKGPDFRFGYGRIDGDKAAQVLENQHYLIDSISHGDSFIHVINVSPTSNTDELRLFLCWRDVPALSSTGTAIVNDLDLMVISPNGDTILPLVPDFTQVNTVAIQRRDTLNTNEQVVIEKPVSGDYKLVVLGRSVPDGKPDFTLTWWENKQGLKLTYPMGGEQWRPPGAGIAAQMITWDAVGISDSFDLFFSADSGASWQKLAGGLPPQTTGWLWNNAPDTLYTNTGFIKVQTTSSSNPIGDSNITPVVIIPHPQFSGPLSIICSERLTLRWSPSIHAQSYKIYQLIEGEMQPIGVTRDTFFVVKSLINNTDYWFANAVIDRGGKEGPRSTATSHRPVAGKNGPEITLQPTNPYTFCSGDPLRLESRSQGTMPMMNQWEYSADSGFSWNVFQPGLETDTFWWDSIRTNFNHMSIRNAYYNECGGFEFTDTLFFQVDTTVWFESVTDIQLLCEGQHAQFTSIPKSYHLPDYQWQLSEDSGSTWMYITDIPHEQLSLDSVTYDMTGFLYRVAASNICGDFHSPPGVLIVRPPLSLSVSEDTVLCTGQTVLLKATGSGGDTLSYVFDWQPTGENGDEITADPDFSQYFGVTLYDNCSLEPIIDSVWVGRRSPLIASLQTADTTICVGTSFDLEYRASGGLEDSIRYYQLDGTPILGNSIRVNPDNPGFFGVMAHDGCSFEQPSDSIWVALFAPLSLTMDMVDSICVGETVVLDPTPSGGLTSGYQIFWDGDLIHQPIKSVNPGKTETYIVTLQDGCTIKADTFAILVPVRDSLRVSLSGPAYICFEEEATITATVSGGIPANYVYVWQPISNPSVPILTHKPTATQDYSLVLQDQCSQEATGAFRVNVNPLPEPDFSILPNPVCQFKAADIRLDNIHPFAISSSSVSIGGLPPLVNTASTATTFSSTGFMDVTISLTDINGCDNVVTMSDFLEVVPMPIPRFSYSPEYITIENNTVTFTSESQRHEQQFWSFSQGGTSSSAVVNVTYADTGVFHITLTAVNRLGCDSVITKSIRVLDVYKALIPNAFSPDQNQVNDLWLPVIRAVKQYKLSVYNRWGELVFESNDISKGWDGMTVRQQPAPEGVYIYQISVIDIHNKSWSEKGSLSLFR
jgi:gliding motility-associated-like protein